MDSKAQTIVSDYEKILVDLNSPNIYSDNQKLITLNQELEKKKTLYDLAKKYLELKKEIEDAEKNLNTSQDTPDKAFYREIITLNKELLNNTETTLSQAFQDTTRSSFASIMEIRAGTGGDEATLFVRDLLRMYLNYAKSKGWQVNILSANDSGRDGLKEVIIEINSKDSYDLLQYESGVHRVQRIPVTETSGRIHTSAASVVTLPQVDEVEIQIDPSELEIFTYRSSGPGGQSVNTTDSAIRITHKPTGISVTCQDRKSQHQNKEYALKILRSKLYDIEAQKRNSSIDTIRKSSIKSGDRSDKIRTYNFPQNRVTDHRIKKSWYGMEDILNGEIDQLLQDIATQLSI